MTVRAAILGLLGATLLCAVSFFNDMVMRGTFLVGNFLPITVFGGLSTPFVNPLLRRLGRGLALSGAELSVIMALLLFACYVPGRGLMHQFTTFLMLPHHYLKTTPGWQGQPPEIQPEQVADPRRLCERLRQCLASGEESWEALRPLLSPGLDGAIAEVLRATSPDPDATRRVRDCLNVLIANPAAADGLRRSRVPLPPYARCLREQPERLTAEQAKDLTRAFLDVTLAEALTPRQPAVLRHVPPIMLADPDAVPALSRGSAERRVDALDGFVNSMAIGDEPIAVGDVPWSAWLRTPASGFRSCLRSASAPRDLPWLCTGNGLTTSASPTRRSSLLRPCCRQRTARLTQYSATAVSGSPRARCSSST